MSLSRKSLRIAIALIAITVATTAAFGLSRTTFASSAFADLIAYIPFVGSNASAEAGSAEAEPVVAPRRLDGRRVDMGENGSLGALIGTYNIPGDYADLAAAIADLNTSGVGGAVTLNVVAGNPQSAPAGGYIVGGAGSLVLTTTSVANTVTIQGNGNTVTASAALTAGSLHDAIFELNGADWITITGFSMQENVANVVTTAASNTMTEWGVALLYVTTTDGAQNNTITGNTIDLNRTYQNTFGIYSNSTHTTTSVTSSVSATGALGGNHGLTITANTITDVNFGIMVIGPTAAADHNDGLTIGGTAPNANTITNYGTTNSFSGYVNIGTTGVSGVWVRNTKNYNVSFNSITSSSGATGITASTTVRGIYVPSASNQPTGTFTNNINSNTIAITPHITTAAINAISVETTTSSPTSTTNINSNNFTTLNHSIASPTGAIIGIIQSGSTTAGPLNHSISNNTFTNLTTASTASFTFISNNWARPTNGVGNINNNSIVTAFNKTGAGGTVTLYTSNSTSGATISEINMNNNFSNITVTGATIIAGWASTDGGSPMKTVTGNTFSNWVGGTSGITGLAVGFSGSSNVSNNLVSDISCSCSITGMTTSSGTDTWSQNTIHSLLSSGIAGSVVTGFAVTGGTTKNIFRNKIYNIATSGTGFGTVNGILISTAPTTANIHNNLIGDLRTPVTSSTDAIRGISGTATTSSTTLNVSFNTIYINATSTGANFGTSGIFHTISTTATTAALNLRNNIIVNTSTAAGSGLTVAYRRSAGAANNLANYGSASNNNLFYAGTPSSTNLIYSDGTSTAQTISDYKNGVFTAGTIAPRDSSSVSENPPFLSTTGSSPNFLHISTLTPTQIESGGTPIGGITDDFDADVRNAVNPDIGADEGSFTSAGDVVPPNISYTVLGNTPSTTDRTLSITVTDVSGVPTAGVGLPVLYFRKGTSGGYSSSQCVFTAGSNYDCTFTYASVGGVVGGDTIQYFIAAQDNAGTPNVAVNPATGASGLTANPPAASTPPSPPASYLIQQSITGTYTVDGVGGGGNFASLTNTGGIFEFINNNVVTGNVTVNISANLTGETGTVALNEFASPHTITFVPTGGARTITGASTSALIRLNGADRVIIDGNYAADDVVGGDPSLRQMTITNTSTGTSSAVIGLMSLGAGAGATNNTIRNLIIVGNAPTTTLFGIFSGSTTISTSSLGTDNDNNVFQNNDVSKVQHGIYSTGASSTNKNTGTVIAFNLLNTASPNQIEESGITVGFEDGVQILENNVGSIQSAGSNDVHGISVGNAINSFTFDGSFTVREVTNALISRNQVGPVTSTSTTGFSAIGIAVAQAATGTNNLVNNVVFGVTAPSTSPDGVAGIYAGASSSPGGTLNAHFNSVYLSGNRGSTSSQYPSFAFVSQSSGDPFLNVRNNAFVNTQTQTGTGSTGKSYGIGVAGPGPFTNFVSNYNDIFVSGAQGVFGISGGLVNTSGVERANLAAWQGATSQDANSQSVDPLFVSTTDLHLQPASPIIDDGLTIAGITIDFDGQTRPQGAAPEIGADEIVPVVPGTLQFSAATYSGAENGGTIALTVTRTGGSDGAVSADVTFGGGTATGGATCGGAEDYDSDTQTVMFANGDSAPKIVNVPVCNDALDEDDETFVGTLGNFMGGATAGTQSTTTVTIQDDDLPPTISINDVTITEPDAGTTSMTFTVTLSTSSGKTVAVNASTADGTAIAPGDYTAISNQLLTFVPGDTSEDFTVTVNGDTSVEPDETLFANLSSPANASILDGQGLGIIDDNDAPAGTLIVTKTADTNDGMCDNDCSLREAIGVANVTLAERTDNGVVQPNTIIFSELFNSPQTITLGGDLLLIAHASGDSLTITGPGSSLLTVDANDLSRVFELDNGDTASISGMTITGGNGGAGTSGTFTGFGGGIYNTGTLTLTDVVVRDNAATIDGGGIYTSTSDTLNLSTSTVRNNSAPDGAGIYGTTGATQTVTRSTISNNTSSGSPSHGGGGVAAFGPTTITNSTISGNSNSEEGGGIYVGGSAAATLRNVTIVGNSSSTSGGGVWVNTTASCDPGDTIVANNTATTSGPDILGTFNSTQGYNLIEITTGGTLNGTTTGNVHGIDPNLAALANNGGPTSTHAPLGGSPAIDRGNSAQVVDQRGMTRPVDLASYGNVANASDIGAVELQTEPTDTTPPTVVSFDDGDADDAVTVNDLLTYTVTFSEDIDAGSVTAADFNNAGTASITVGTINEGSPGVFSVQVTPTTTGSLTLRIPTGAVVEDVSGNDLAVPVQDDTTVTVTAVAAPGTIVLSSATYLVTENVGMATITVNRVGGSDGAVGISYATVAGGTATAGGACGGSVDYVSASGMLAWGNGDSAAKTFDIPVCDDATDEDDQTVNLSITSPTGGATLGSPNTAVLTIQDNDAPPTISINDVMLNEGNSGTTNFTFAVTLSAASEKAITVNVSTADNTATAPSDYTAFSNQMLTFVAGDTSENVTVAVNGDTTFEPNETFFANLTSPVNATVNDGQGVGTITNDDAVDYTVTTAGNVIVVTDVSGNNDTMTISQPGASQITFAVAGRTFSVDGGAAMVGSSGNISLTGVTSITVNGAVGHDTINFGAFPSLPSLTVNSGTGNDHVQFNGNITFAANANLDVDLQNDDASPGTDDAASLNNADLVLSGTGAAVVRVSKFILVGSGSSLVTSNGNITLESNQQTTPTVGGFHGIDVNGATIEATGTGVVTLNGRAGNAANNIGVFVRGGSTIRGGSTSGSTTTSVTGRGGTSGSSNPHGIQVDNASITSFGGDVFVSGTSGPGTGANNYGVVPINNGTITSGGNGNVVVQGTGGTNAGGGNAGIIVHQGVGLITSGGTGTVTVTGTGGAGGSSHGVQMFRNGRITSGGSGTVSINGSASGSGSHGVFVQGLDNHAQINSGGGAITITGTSTGGTDIVIDTGGGQQTIASSGNAAVDLVGDTMSLDAPNTTISAGTGTVTLRQRTTGRTIDLGAADSGTQLGLTNAELNKIAATSTVAIGDSNSGAVNVSNVISQTRTVNILTLSTTTVLSTGSLGIFGTVSGPLTAATGGAVRPGSSPGVINSGNLNLQANSTYFAEIGGTTAGNGAGFHDQLNVSGTVTLGGGSLDLTAVGGFSPAVGQTFTIINNDGSDAVSGNFLGLSEGAMIPNFLGGSRPAQITYAGGSGNDVVLTVLATPGTLQFSSATYNGSETGPVIALTVTRTGGTDGAVSAQVSFSGGTATGGSACGGSVDYDSDAQTVNFASGSSTSQVVNVPICDDAIFEGADETFGASLGSFTGGATGGSPTSATVTINENDTQPTVQFSSATYTTAESLNGDGDSGIPVPGALITVTRSGALGNQVTVDYGVIAGGTATGGASCTPGVDYITPSGTLTFIAGDTSESFFVQTCFDAEFEGDETVNLGLSNVTGGGALGMPSTAVLTISDNDVPTIQLSSATYLEDESQTLVVTVTRSGSGSGTSSVQLTTSGGTASGGTCGGSADYASQNVTVTFTGLDNVETVNIPICADLFKEPSETFNITLSSPSNATLGSPSSAVATINDAATQFMNTSPIVINESGAANPYPSQIMVSGATGSIAYLRVTLFDLAADIADDIDVLLVGPQGQSFVLMADAGGANPIATGTTLTFNDNAATFLPDSTALSSGTFKASSWENLPSIFPAPAPVGPHAEPGPGGTPAPRSAFLNTVFAGTNANGVWSLYIFDDSGAPLSLAPGAVAGGWGLEALAPTAAPLSLSGRAIDASGRGIRNVVVVLEGGPLTAPRFASTGSFGHFSFDGLSTGTYFVTVNAKRYTFTVPSRVVTLSDSVTDVDFIAEPLE